MKENWTVHPRRSSRGLAFGIRSFVEVGVGGGGLCKLEIRNSAFFKFFIRVR